MGRYEGIIASGISAGASARQNRLNREWSANEAAKARQHATSERIAAQNWDLDMWNLQNEYNDPAAQMERMKAAGINPAAAAQGISGNGSEAGAVDGSSPGSSPMASMPQQFDIGASLRQGAQTFWQNRKLAAETEGIAIDNQYKPSMNEANLDKLSAEVKKHFADIEGVRATTDNVRALTRQIEALTPAQRDLLVAQTQQFISQSKLNDAKTKSEEKMPDLLVAQTSNENASAELKLNQAWTEKQKGIVAEYEALKAQYKKTLLDNGVMLGEHELDMVIAYAQMHDGNISGLVEVINSWNTQSTQGQFERQTGWQANQNKRDRWTSFGKTGLMIGAGLLGTALSGGNPVVGAAAATGLGSLFGGFGNRGVMNPAPGYSLKYSSPNASANNFNFYDASYTK